MVYHGLMFSKEGVSPDCRKVQAIREAGRPRNATEFNSFLCTVRYCSRFMEPSKYQNAVCNLGELLRGKLEWMQEYTVVTRYKPTSIPRRNRSSTWTGVRWDWQPLSRSGSLENKCDKLCSTLVEASQIQKTVQPDRARSFSG